MVEDPYLFGQIAATNALSDIYAMGGDVKTALNIVCFPESMDLNILGKILQGGAEGAGSRRKISPPAAIQLLTVMSNMDCQLQA